MNRSFPDDELVKIWTNDPPPVKRTDQEVMALVTQRQKRLEKRVRVRDWLEIIAAAIVCAFFFWAALHSQNLLQRTGNWMIVAAGAWIIYYLRAHRFRDFQSDPTLDLQNYTRELLSVYEKQIRLLRQVKYWYLLPLYIGLVVGWAGTLALHREGGWMKPVLSIIFITGLFGTIWWLNEVWAVRKVSAERDRIRAMFPEGDKPN